ncbi:hypothetical protein [Amycolatopsis pigmentata]|uniref:Uncharacterized protein n=1 Tax=Amycolatopsis pigmentata TaxID=450801 RepID=A0ABW5G3G5_9PSEU
MTTVPPADQSETDAAVEAAIATVARHYIAKAVRDAKDFDRIVWEDYPELCAVDFDRVGNLAVGIAAGLEDNPAAYEAAIRRLAARASDQEPQP